MKPSKRKIRSSNCLFCNISVTDSGGLLFYCPACEISFDYYDNSQNLQILRYSLQNKHQTVSHVIMSLFANKTYINYRDAKFGNGHLVKTFSGTWPTTHPNDIVSLIERLEKLTAFA